jgi:hypothetical protein
LAYRSAWSSLAVGLNHVSPIALDLVRAIER